MALLQCGMHSTSMYHARACQTAWPWLPCGHLPPYSTFSDPPDCFSCTSLWCPITHRSACALPCGHRGARVHSYRGCCISNQSPGFSTAAEGSQHCSIQERLDPEGSGGHIVVAICHALCGKSGETMTRRRPLGRPSDVERVGVRALNSMTRPALAIQASQGL
jgi:hypothetical protein